MGRYFYTVQYKYRSEENVISFATQFKFMKNYGMSLKYVPCWDLRFY